MNLRKNFEKESIKKYIWLGGLWYLTHATIIAAIFLVAIILMIPLTIISILFDPWINENILNIVGVALIILFLIVGLYVAGFVATMLKWKREEEEENLNHQP